MKSYLLHLAPRLTWLGLLFGLASPPLWAQTAGTSQTAASTPASAPTITITPAATPAMTPTLTPAPARITDRAISADQQTYEAMQARLRAVNAAGRPLRDYFLAKAQCWLDVSFHEYNRNDRGPFAQDALAQADLLANGMTNGMASGQPPLTQDTALISGAERLRPDLWAQAQALKAHSGWRCAQQPLACAEVELVHAGHEQVQQQWRHARPYVQIAEDLLAEAQALAERCDPPPPPPPPPVIEPAPTRTPLPPPVLLLPPVRSVQMIASVVFNFDRSAEADLRAFSLAQLQTLASRIQADGLVVRKVQLAGHADRLNGTGQPDYNQRLSERRVATVRALLARLGLAGLDAAVVNTQALGDGQPVQACAGAFASPAERQECLLPNRRVDVLITADPARR